MLNLRKYFILNDQYSHFLFSTIVFFVKNIHPKDYIITYKYAASSNQHSQLSDPLIQNVSQIHTPRVSYLLRQLKT